MLMARVVASLSDLPVNYYRNGELNESQQKELDAVKEEICRLKLRIVDRQAQSMGAFKALCKQHVEEFGVKVIFVDYLQLLSSNRYRNSRELEISHISRELKNLARDLNICVVATSQLSRSVEQRGGDKRPILSDLRESGAIEQDADKVFFLYRPEYYGFMINDMGMSNERLLELIMAKNRSGALERVRLKIDKFFTRFIPFEETNTTFEVNEDRIDDFKEVPF
jgi:replicative DNA helicase